MPQTPYPAAIHACSCTLTQKSGYIVCPSASSFAGVSDELVAAPGFEAGSVQADHTFVGGCAGARTLADSARACACVRPIDDEDDDEGEGVAGSYMLPSSIPSGATD